MEVFIPFDIIIMEILSRISIRCIGRCRLLSKEFNQMTYHPKFQFLHSQRTLTQSCFLLQTSQNFVIRFSYLSSEHEFDISLSFLPGYDPQILAVSKSHGLFLVQTTRKPLLPIYSVCKPMTKQWIKIPLPPTTYLYVCDHVAMLVLNSTKHGHLHYKIVRFSREFIPDIVPKRHDVSYYVCEVFDSETWKWKRLDDVILIGRPMLLYHSAVSVSGAVHWRLGGDAILGFHLEEEKWSRFEFPKEKLNGIVELVEYEGKLGLMHIGRGGLFEVWVMEKYGSEIWNRRVIITDSSIKDLPKCIPLAFYTSDIALIWKRFMRSDLILYDIKKNKYTEIQSRTHIHKPFIFPFWSDYEHVHLLAKRRKRKRLN